MPQNAGSAAVLASASCDASTWSNGEVGPNDERGAGRSRLVRSGLADDGSTAYVLETTHSEASRRPDPVETSVVPLVVKEPALAERLVDQFRRQLRTHLTGDELTFLDSLIVEPQFDVALLDGVQVLRLTYFGGQSWIEWDGTEVDAKDIVSGMAELFAGSISSDHWQNAEGWRSWQSGADSK